MVNARTGPTASHCSNRAWVSASGSLAPCPNTIVSPGRTKSPRSRAAAGTAGMTLPPRPLPRSLMLAVPPPSPRGSVVEVDDGARDLAPLHGGVAVVHVVEADVATDHLVQQEPAVEVHLDEVRDVLAELVRAHHRALQLALGQQIRPADLDAHTARDHADDGGGAADVGHAVGLLGRLLQPDGLEAVVDAAARHALHLGHHVVDRLGVHDVGGAELAGDLELLVRHVDHDHL